MNSSRKSYYLILVSIFLIFILLSSAIVVSAQQTSAIEFFKNKNMNFIVSRTPGGGFDAYARFLAPFIEKYIPGVTVVVKNIPGAGGLIANDVVYLSEPNGLTIEIIDAPGSIFSQVAENEGAQFDMEKFSWLARVTSEPHVLAVGSKTGLKSIEDLKSLGRPIKLAFTGVGSDDYTAGILVFKAFNIPMDPIPGYGGQAEATLAVVRGEVEGTQATYSSLLSFFNSKDLIPILQLANEKDIIEGIPNAKDILKDKERDLVLALTNIFTLDRSIVGPPGIPEDTLKVLRDAIYSSLNDPEFIAICKKAGRPISALEGHVVEGLIKDAMAQADAIKSVLVGLKK